MLPVELSETSALAVDGDSVWTLNDSGNGPWLYRLNSAGRLGKRVRLQGAVNIDWESLATSGQFLYILDCGNNTGKREWLQFYRVAWSALRAAGDGEQVPAHLAEFRYADAAPVYGPQDQDNDCEAATMIDGHLWLWTKGWHSQHSRVYRLDPKRSTQALSGVAEWPVQGLVTGADYSPQRHQLVLLGYRLGVLSVSSFIWLVPVRDGNPYWPEARRFDLWPAGQWEGVAWRGGRLLLSREQSVLGAPWLGEVVVP